VRRWPSGDLQRVLEPLVRSVAAAVEVAMTGPRRRRWSWPASSLWPRRPGCAGHAAAADAGCIGCYRALEVAA
jgi:hypothetical protein